MSKVNNLRALFESGNKEENSPPDRGRSPGLSAGQSGTESPRPLSKIRTNFVAVEKDGRIGLKRDPSSDSVISKKASDDSDKPVTAVTLQSDQDTPPSLTDRLHKQNKPLQMETIPQSPQHDSTKTGQDATSGQTTGPIPGKVAPGQAEGKNTDSAQAEGPVTTSKPAKANPGSNLNGKTALDRDKPKAANRASPAKEIKTPKALSVATAKTNSRPAKSPTAQKTPTSPAKGTKLPSKTPEKRALDPQKSATPKLTPKAATRTTGSTTGTAAHLKDALTKNTLGAKKPPTVQISQSDSLDRGVGFVKPKPKSPTRPITLPAGLTTHTAASTTRTVASRQSLSQQSGSYQNLHSSRSPSRTSISTIGGTLRRQSSTINRPRPSIGPPPKPAAVDHPITKRDAQVDESFLARMMRPTQASSSKTQEKAVGSPPRKAPGIGNATKRSVVAKDAVAGATRKTAPRAEGLTRKLISKPDDKATPPKGAASTTTHKPKSHGTAVKVADKPETTKIPEPAVEAEPPAPKMGELDATKEEVLKVESVVDDPSQASQPALELATEPSEPESTEPAEATAPVDAASLENAPFESEPVPAVGDAPVEPAPDATAGDELLAETATEAEPTEPKTPVDVTSIQEPAGLADGNSDEKAEPMNVLDIKKPEDGTTVVAN